MAFPARLITQSLTCTHFNGGRMSPQEPPAGLRENDSEPVTWLVTKAEGF